MSPPWMPLYIADYLGDTTHLGAAEHGAYLLLIMHYWLTCGTIPDDDRQLARIVRMAPGEWKRVRPIIQAFFSNGWQHHRIDGEIAKANAKHERRQGAGKAGGIAKAIAQQKPSNATDLLEQCSSNALASSSQPERKIPEANASGPTQAELERDLFKRGRQVCGKASGGLIASLLKAKQHDVALARSVIEMASTKNDPREYVAASTRSTTQNGKRSATMEAFDDLIARSEGFEVEGDPPMRDITPPSS